MIASIHLMGSSRVDRRAPFPAQPPVPPALLFAARPVPGRDMVLFAGRTEKPFKPFKLTDAQRKELLKSMSYPRPQFVRNDWKSLNGQWEFAFDDQNVGLKEGWDKAPSLPQKIRVPFAYQVKRSGINDRSIHEVVWYKKNVTVPPQWQTPEKDILVHFNAVDYKTDVWVNGIPAGGNQGGHVPFSVNITPYLKKDGSPNQITLRVEDSQDVRQLRGKQHNKGFAEVIDYFCTTGIWQNVWMEPVPKIRFLPEGFKITNTPGGHGVNVQIPINAPRGELTVELEALNGEKVIAQSAVRNAGGVVKAHLSIPNPRLWSPDHPNLYDMRIRLKDKQGNVIDEVTSYFGLRTVGTRNGWITLNGKPVFLKMVLDQGYWPQSNITPPSTQSLLYDVEMIKRYGFNGVRKHQKIEDPRYLYLCDKLGLMVWGEMANSRVWSPEMERELKEEMAREIERDYNHPSIIAWVPLNESWGVHEIDKDPRQFAFAERIVNHIRTLDPTRLVIDNDGWEQTNVPDVIGIHDYRTPEKMRETYGHLKRGQIPPQGIPGQPRSTLVQGARYQGQPVIFSEVGGFLKIPRGKSREELDRLYNSYQNVRTPRELERKYEELMKTLASFDITAGFCYTQLTDVEQEMNGLMTYDRKPRVAPEKIAEIHRRVFAQKEREAQQS